MEQHFRKKGTGSIRRERGRPGWSIVSPAAKGERQQRIGGGFDTYRAAEKALDAWLAQRNPKSR